MTRGTFVLFVFICLIFWTVSTKVDAREIKHRRFTHSWNDATQGTRCLRMEVLDDDLIHFEIYERRDPNHKNGCLREDDMIWFTPMVDGFNQPNSLYFDPNRQAPYQTTYKAGYQGPESYTELGDGFETKELRVNVLRDSRCINIFDKLRNADLTQICAEELDSPKNKFLRIKKKQMSNFYGVGNQFTRTTPDGDWNGMVWDASKKADRPGHMRGPDFFGGAPSTSQFPMVYSLGPDYLNYGIFFDQEYRMTMDFSERDQFTYETYGDEIRFFVMSGPNLKDLRADYLELTGRPPVPPKSQFGHWTSKFGFNSFDEAEAEVAALRKNGFPLDGVALDLQWFGGKFGNPDIFRMGVLQFVTAALDHPLEPNSPSFDNSDERVPEFYDKWGTHFMPIEELYVDERLDEYKALAFSEFRETHPGFDKIDADNGCFVARANLNKGEAWVPAIVDVDFKRTLAPKQTVWWGRGSMLDTSNRHARYYWHQLKRRWLAKKGIFAYWLDLVEPEMFAEYAYYYGFPELYREWKDWDGSIQKNVVQKHGDIHNFYGALFQPMGLEEGFASEASATFLKPTMKRLYKQDYEAGPRHWALFRAGTPGSQRYGGLWSGDTRGNYQNFNAQLQTQLHMSLLVDYYSGDTGGFFHQNEKDPKDPFDAELYKQWYATASLTDIPLRPHGWALDPGISYGAHVRGHLDSNRANAWRRYELIPYMYSLAHRAHRFGEAMFPPLVYNYQTDMAVRTDGTEKMMGQDLLFRVVAEEGKVRVPVYLPKGTWYDYESLEAFDSNRGLTGDIDLYRRERVPSSEPKSTYYFMNPLFAKEGAIIPKSYVDENTMNALGKRWGQPPREELGLRVFSGAAETDFTVYEDDGVSRSYLQGKVRETKVHQGRDVKGALVVIDASPLNKFTGAVNQRKNLVELVVRNEQVKAKGGVLVNGQPLARCDFDATADPLAAAKKFDLAQQTCWYQPNNRLVRARTAELSVDQAKRIEFKFE